MSVADKIDTISLEGFTRYFPDAHLVINIDLPIFVGSSHSQGDIYFLNLILIGLFKYSINIFSIISKSNIHTTIFLWFY